MLGSDILTRGTIENFFKGKTIKQQAAVVPLMCEIYGKGDTFIDVYVPKQNPTINLRGMFNDVQVTLAQVAGNGISATLK